MDLSGYVKAIMDYPMEHIDGGSVLEILFEYYDTQRRIDSDEIRTRYNKLYEQINHKPIKEITEIEMPMYWLISEYEARGFKEGVKVGLMLANELISK